MADSFSNFLFIKEHNPVFFQQASTAEKIFSHDPNTTLVKLRQLGEAMIPFEQCVDLAMEKIHAILQWSTPQKRWLDRLAK